MVLPLMSEELPQRRTSIRPVAALPVPSKPKGEEGGQEQDATKSSVSGASSE